MQIELSSFSFDLLQLSSFYSVCVPSNVHVQYFGKLACCQHATYSWTLFHDYNFGYQICWLQSSLSCLSNRALFRVHRSDNVFFRHKDLLLHPRARSRSSRKGSAVWNKFCPLKRVFLPDKKITTATICFFRRQQSRISVIVGTVFSSISKWFKHQTRW